MKKPIPVKGEILIRIHATSATSGDARIRRADPFLIRLIFGFFKPRNSVLGVVVSGTVEETGGPSEKFKVGDEVFGTTGMKFRAYAEYVCLPQEAVLAVKPTNLSFEQAAAIPFGAMASLYFLRKGNIHRGQKVLIYGASGALGTAAVQMAKNYGAEVTAVCSGKNAQLVRELGADHVIDYTTTKLSELDERYDIVNETVGKSRFGDMTQLLKKKGTLLMASADFGTMIRGMFTTLFTQKTVMSGVAKESSDDMTHIRNLVITGKLKPVIENIFPLKKIAEAHRHIDLGHKSGNIVVTV